MYGARNWEDRLAGGLLPWNRPPSPIWYHGKGGEQKISKRTTSCFFEKPLSEEKAIPKYTNLCHTRSFNLFFQFSAFKFYSWIVVNSFNKRINFQNAKMALVKPKI